MPRPGVAAEFGANVQGLSVIFEAAVRTGEDYAIVTRIHNAPTIEIDDSVLTLWECRPIPVTTLGAT